MGWLEMKREKSSWKKAFLAAGAVGLALLLWPGEARGAQGGEESPMTGAHEVGAEQVRQFNQERIDRNRRALKVLLGWAATNVAVGVPAAIASEGRQQHFFEMTAAWNVVNGAIAGAGLVGMSREDPGQGDLWEAVGASHSLEKVLALNVGLNMAYIAAGGFLWERGLRTESDRLRGYGPAMMIQGGFLLGFDSILFVATRRHRRNFELRLQPIPQGVGVGVQWR